MLLSWFLIPFEHSMKHVWKRMQVYDKPMMYAPVAVVCMCRCMPSLLPRMSITWYTQVIDIYENQSLSSSTGVTCRQRRGVGPWTRDCVSPALDTLTNSQSNGTTHRVVLLPLLLKYMYVQLILMACFVNFHFQIAIIFFGTLNNTFYLLFLLPNDLLILSCLCQKWTNF